MLRGISNTYGRTGYQQSRGRDACAGQAERRTSAPFLPSACTQLLQAIAVLEKALHAAPATIAVAEPFLFNLCEPLSITHGTKVADHVSYSDSLRTPIGQRGQQQARAAHYGGALQRRWLAYDLSEDAHVIGVLSSSIRAFVLASDVSLVRCFDEHFMRSDA